MSTFPLKDDVFPRLLNATLCGPSVAALEDVTSIISSYLGPSPSLSLRQVCSFESTKLLNWIWDSSCTSSTNRPSVWFLNNSDQIRTIIGSNSPPHCN
ncbi:hypothetical protein PHMEG_00039573, partial [Phytophthora megakarya]